MKILIVAHDSNFSGGANRSLFTNIQVLQKRYGVEILVLLPSDNGPLNIKLDEISVQWISTKYFGVVSGLRHDGKDVLRRLKVYLGYYIEKVSAIKVVKLLKDEKIDLVYTNTRLPMIGANIANKLRVPHVVHVREFGTVEPLWGRWDFRTMYDNSDKIILISKALKEQFAIHIPEDKLIVSQNGIQYDPVEYRDDNLSNDELHIIITGRLVPDKGHKDAIYALDKIVKEKKIKKKVILHIVGSSPKRTHIEWYEADIQKLVTDLVLDEYVVFEGEISDMPSIRAKMDMELICSICETFGRVTVEAMRACLFVIGSNTGGTPEIIDNGKNGLLYEQGNADDLASKIVQAISDKFEFNKIRRYALLTSMSSFTVDKNCTDIYNNLIKCVNEGIE